MHVHVVAGAHVHRERVDVRCMSPERGAGGHEGRGVTVGGDEGLDHLVSRKVSEWVSKQAGN